MKPESVPCGERPFQEPAVKVVNPRLRVPVSLIIDDSTCLVNLNRFAIPQFIASGVPRSDFARMDWREMPHEIPDDFVRRFGEWCGENGVKGKYSIVPYPACVGRVDRILPYWAASELDASIELVHALMTPNWDIHPEMVTHTRVIDTKTGHPYPDRGPRFQENWEWTDGKSSDEIENYMRYGLQILKNVGFQCEGITTPGGFGNRVLPELAKATLNSCRGIHGARLTHYFRHIFTGDESVRPRVQYASRLESDEPECVVSIIGCTGDWTGGWDCSSRGDVDRFITPDLSSGRMVEVIDRGEPACIVCHWQGIYFNGEEVGFGIFRELVRRLHARYDHIQWMKLSEIARYWAAKELTRIEKDVNEIKFSAPFECPGFTFEMDASVGAPGSAECESSSNALTEVNSSLDLDSGQWMSSAEKVTVCVDLPRGISRVVLG
ncbi:MAG: hypothetical protein QGF00_25300 [Planctomycetota bacterium]|nr:hypothetical protein [Planctomycetota bacterium]